MCAWHFSVPFNKRDGEKVSDPFQGKIGMLSDLQITWRFSFQPKKKKVASNNPPPTHQPNHQPTNQPFSPLYVDREDFPNHLGRNPSFQGKW